MFSFLCGTVFILLLLRFPESYAEEEETIKISRKLIKDGFHRDVETSVSLHAINNSDCQYLLIESLPAGCYVDVYQIKQMATIKVWTDSVINLESPEYLSTAHKVYIHLDRNEQVEVTLPVHLRYHRPSSEEFVQVYVPNPKLYISCTDESPGVLTSLACADQMTSCNSATDLAGWSEMKYSIDSGDLSAAVPVGQISHKPSVVAVTLAVTWGGCVWLLYKISSKSPDHSHID